MVGAKRLAQLAKKWQDGGHGEEEDHQTMTAKRAAKESCATISVVVKGHCVVYTSEGERFEIPVAYLCTAVFGKLLRMSQEEFGFEGNDGRIMLHCDTMLMQYAMCLLRRDASTEVVKAS